MNPWETSASARWDSGRREEAPVQDLPWIFVNHKTESPIFVETASSKWVFPKNRGTRYPQIMNLNRVFHYKPSILGYHGYPYFWKHPNGCFVCFSSYILTFVFKKNKPSPGFPGWIYWKFSDNKLNKHAKISNQMLILFCKMVMSSVEGNSTNIIFIKKH